MGFKTQKRRVCHVLFIYSVGRGGPLTRGSVLGDGSEPGSGWGGGLQKCACGSGRLRCCSLCAIDLLPAGCWGNFSFGQVERRSVKRTFCPWRDPQTRVLIDFQACVKSKHCGKNTTAIILDPNRLLYLDIRRAGGTAWVSRNSDLEALFIFFLLDKTNEIHSCTVSGG